MCFQQLHTDPGGSPHVSANNVFGYSSKACLRRDGSAFLPPGDSKYNERYSFVMGPSSLSGTDAQPFSGVKSWRQRDLQRSGQRPGQLLFLSGSSLTKLLRSEERSSFPCTSGGLILSDRSTSTIGRIPSVPTDLFWQREPRPTCCDSSFLECSSRSGTSSSSRATCSKHGWQPSQSGAWPLSLLRIHVRVARLVADELDDAEFALPGGAALIAAGVSATERKISTSQAD